MKPTPDYIALNRATFGATSEEIARVESIGWSAWVEEQLKPDASAKDDAVKRLASHKLEIEYEHEGMMAPAMMMKAEKPAMMDAEGKKAEKQKFKVKEKRGLTMLNSPGTIDSDYRGEIMCIVVNLSNEPQTIEPGERIAQMIIARYEQIAWEEVDTLEETNRSSGGFGSTGVK